MMSQADLVRHCRARAWLAQGRSHWLAFGIVLAAVAVLHGLTLLRWPMPFVDEAWLAARAYRYIQTGKAFSSLDAGFPDRYPGYWTCYPWVLPRIQAVFIRLLGLSLFSARLASLAFGLILLAALYSIASRLAGRRAALLSMLLVSLSIPFLASAHMARYDVIAAALGMVAVALHVSDRGPALSLRSVVAGLAVGLAFEVHPNAAIYGPAIVALYLLDGSWRSLRTARFWGYVGGVCAGLAWFAAVHILPYPETYVALMGISFGPTHTPPLVGGGPAAWLRSLGELGRLLVVMDGPQLPVTLAAIGSLALRRSGADSKMLVLAGVLLLSFAAVVRNKVGFYAIMIMPALSLMTAAFLVKLGQDWAMARRQARRARGAALSLLAVLAGCTVLAGVAHNLSLLGGNPMRDYEAAAQELRQVIPRQASIVGSQVFWFSLPDQLYYSWDVLPGHRHYAPGTTLADAFRALRPDYLIMDGRLERYIVDEWGGTDVYQEYYSVLRPELEAFLRSQATLVSCTTTETFGEVRVYRIGWD